MVRFSIEKHPICYVSDIVASTYGNHIKSVTCTEDRDQGTLYALKKQIDLDLYEDGDIPTDFELEVVLQANNGNWYVRANKATGVNVWLGYNETLIAEEYNNEFKDLANFFTGKGEELRVYQLQDFDTFEVSADAFTVPADAAVGKKITSVDATTHKMVLA